MLASNQGAAFHRSLLTNFPGQETSIKVELDSRDPRASMGGADGVTHEAHVDEKIFFRHV